MDVKIVLIAKGYINTINEPNPQNPIPEAQKFSTLHFLRHHLHHDLKAEYMMEDDPKKLWDSLKERYNQQQGVILPEARREWSLLHLMDFKSVAEYNYAVHKICTKLRFCNQPLDDAEMIEKTLSTFLHANRILQHQYRRHKYTKYSDLIYDLLQEEKHDELLTKNHQMLPVGATPLPEVHFNAQNNKKFSGKKFRTNFKGKWKKQNFKKGKGSSNIKDTFKKNNTHGNSQACQRCNCHNHTTRKCHTAKHLIDLYQKHAGKQVHVDKFEAHFTTHTPGAGCSKDVPVKHNKVKDPMQLDEFFGTDDMMIDSIDGTNNMLVDGPSNDVFRDMS
jgi:hypothetical protein